MPSGRFWTPAELEILRNEYRKGNAKEIAAKLNRSVTSVRNMAGIIGITDDQWTDEEIAILRGRYPTEGAEPLLELLKKSKRSIHHKARRLGVVCQNKHKLQAHSKMMGVESVDIYFFETWSADMAWILGYIWADGSVIADARQNKLQFGCKLEDEEIIHFIRKTMKITHETYQLKSKYIYKGEERSKDQIRLYACSKYLVDSLVNHGLRQNKSNLDLSYPTVPDEWLPHFVRGLFDGDGCVGHYPTGSVIEFLGSNKFILGLQEQICRLLGIRKMKIGEKHGVSTLHWYHRDERLALFHWLYPPSSDYFFLRRKKLAFSESLGIS